MAWSWLLGSLKFCAGQVRDEWRCKHMRTGALSSVWDPGEQEELARRWFENVLL
jgi:hypothetical protein